jgi:hypothetical protein
MSTTELKFSTRNITRVFRSATPEEIDAGRQWYQRARALAVELANMPEWSEPDVWEEEVTKAAAVIAVLSPRVSWPRNRELVQHVYRLASGGWWAKAGATVETVRAGWQHGLSDGATKAFRMLVLGEDPDDVVKGPKVRQFWHTIVDPSDPRAVVVDRHAFDVAAGRVTNDDSRKILSRVGVYDEISQLYRQAAKALQGQQLLADGIVDLTGITPAEVQAVTWTVWRRTHAAAYHGE